MIKQETYSPATVKAGKGARKAAVWLRGNQDTQGAENSVRVRGLDVVLAKELLCVQNVREHGVAERPQPAQMGQLLSVSCAGNTHQQKSRITAQRDQKRHVLLGMSPVRTMQLL